MQPAPVGRMHHQYHHYPTDSLSMTTGLSNNTGNSDESLVVLIEEEETSTGSSTLPSYYASAQSNEDFSDLGNDNNNNNNNNHSLVAQCVKYLYALSRILVVEVLVDLISADNPSLLSKLLRCACTLVSYSFWYTSLTGQLLWGIAYLMDHGWYLLAASGSVTLLLLSSLFLTSYEWIWRWQERWFIPLARKCGRTCSMTFAGSMDYTAVATTTSTDTDGPQQRLRRPVIIHDEEDMDDDLSLRGWLKRFARIFGLCLGWLLYCIVNIKVDFWITDQYMLARPEYHRYELQMVNSVEAAPIILGAAILLYVAYPPLYTWHDAPAMVQDGIIVIAQMDEGLVGTASEDRQVVMEQESTTLQCLL
jgi:hypothetical protein